VCHSLQGNAYLTDYGDPVDLSYTYDVVNALTAVADADDADYSCTVSSDANGNIAEVLEQQWSGGEPVAAWQAGSPPYWLWRGGPQCWWGGPPRWRGAPPRWWGVPPCPPSFFAWVAQASRLRLRWQAGSLVY
jgi:hypothetical protein